MIVDIIGAGIGGLTTAIALEQKGFSVRIFEQATALKPVGAGIILASNAMQVLDKLGFRVLIENNSTPVSSIQIAKGDLTPLSKIDLSFFEKKYNLSNRAIHRGQLQSLLLTQLKKTELFLGHELSSIHSNTNGQTLHFKNGKSIESSLLIGADGINSTVRKLVFEQDATQDTIRKAGQICWRGIATIALPSMYNGTLIEAWGKTDRFGFVPLTDQRVYWYALQSGGSLTDIGSKEKISDVFSTYNPMVNQIISSTNPDHIHVAEIKDLEPMKNWYKAHICLMGMRLMQLHRIWVRVHAKLLRMHMLLVRV